MEPKPVQQPSIPIWIGARAPAALRRTVEMADGWMGAGSASIVDYIDQQTIMRGILAEKGIAPGAFPISKRVYMAVDSDRERARERMRTWVGQYYGNPEVASAWAVTGTVEDVATVLTRLRVGGATHIMLHPPFDHEEQMEIIAKDLAPLL
jgi:alkanesulfonate monooxygenase SsuD/methylene tetrahydromethanopterin reductase-like flavin-dependent oxidoreductase (luciferase family)